MSKLTPLAGASQTTSRSAIWSTVLLISEETIRTPSFACNKVCSGPMYAGDTKRKIRLILFQVHTDKND